MYSQPLSKNDVSKVYESRIEDIYTKKETANISSPHTS